MNAYLGVPPGCQDIRPIGARPCTVRPSASARDGISILVGVDRMFTGSSGRLFYRVFLPLAVVVNLGLGLVILGYLRPDGWLGLLEVATGAFCCVVAGWLAAAAWSKSYWVSAMTRQVNAWRQIADAIFVWLEEAPLPADALQRLNRSLEEVHQPRSSST